MDVANRESLVPEVPRILGLPPAPEARGHPIFALFGFVFGPTRIGFAPRRLTGARTKTPKAPIGPIRAKQMHKNTKTMSNNVLFGGPRASPGAGGRPRMRGT